jgi:hypothetical protein
MPEFTGDEIERLMMREALHAGEVLCDSLELAEVVAFGHGPFLVHGPDEVPTANQARPTATVMNLSGRSTAWLRVVGTPACA